ELAPRQVGGDGRGRLQPGEAAALGRRLARVAADVRPREQRAEARDLPAGDSRAHHPETRVLDQESLGGVAVDLGGHEDELAVRGECQRFHRPHVHRLVLDLGLVDLDPLARDEGDGDRGTLVPHRFQREEAADDGGEDRHDPDELERARPGLALDRLGDRLVLAHGASTASQVSRGSKLIDAIMVRITTPAKYNAPGPGTIEANALSCTIATSTAPT